MQFKNDYIGLDGLWLLWMAMQSSVGWTCGKVKQQIKTLPVCTIPSRLVHCFTYFIYILLFLQWAEGTVQLYCSPQWLGEVGQIFFFTPIGYGKISQWQLWVHGGWGLISGFPQPTNDFESSWSYLCPTLTLRYSVSLLSIAPGQGESTRLRFILPEISMDNVSGMACLPSAVEVGLHSIFSGCRAVLGLLCPVVCN